VSLLSVDFNWGDFSIEASSLVVKKKKKKKEEEE